jgi:O-antigen ligase
MFAIPVILALAGFIYLRPQEILPVLQKIPFLYLFSALLPVAWALDVRAGFVRIRNTPLLVWTLLFFGWSILTVWVHAPLSAFKETIFAGVSLLLFLATSQGIQSFRGIRGFAVGLLAITMVITTVVLHQAFAPLGCVKQEESEATDTLYPDGRPCETRAQCFEGITDYDAVYLCEHVGMLGTTSIGGRVRYRGILQDPNETALVLSAGVPLAFALASRIGPASSLLVPAALVPIGMAVVFTKSRSGQLAFLAAIGVYFLRRLRWVGVLLALPLAAPVLLLGGRSSSEADESANERLEAWSEGLEMWRSNPLLGVGRGQFVENHYLTAHNSFILALAESGAVGLFLWASVLYLAFKTTVSLATSKEASANRDVRTWSAALFASLCSITVSSFFLSFSNHDIFWLQIGFVGALAGTAQTHLPNWRIRYRLWEMLLVGAGCTALIFAIFVYARLKG